MGGAESQPAPQNGTVQNRESHFNDVVLRSVDRQSKMPNGDQVTIVDTIGDEYKVFWRGQEGLVKMHHIQTVANPQPGAERGGGWAAASVQAGAGAEGNAILGLWKYDQGYFTIAYQNGRLLYSERTRQGTVTGVLLGQQDGAFRGMLTCNGTPCAEMKLRLTGQHTMKSAGKMLPHGGWEQEVDAYRQNEAESRTMGKAWQAEGHAEVILRQSPAQGRIVAMVPNGEVLKVLHWEGDCLKVKWKEYEGWSKACNVELAAIPGYAMSDFSIRNPDHSVGARHVDRERSIGNKIYMSCQHTGEAIKQTKPLTRIGSSVVKASMPPFNLSKTPGMEPVCPDMVPYNVPSFGPIITQAVMKMFQSREMQDLATKMNIRIPTPAINTVVQKKLSNVFPLIQDLRSKNYNEMAVQKLEGFVKAAANLKDIRHQGEWTEIIRQHCKPGWETKLHVDDVLQNFGFAEAVGLAYRGDEWKQALRWLSKTFECFGIQGSMCDVVNLVYALRQSRDPGTPPISEVIAFVNDFANLLSQLSPANSNGLWIPTHIVLDCEVDDMLAFLLLAFIHQRLGSAFSLVVQLPLPNAFDGIAAHLTRLNSLAPRIVQNSSIFRDRDSANADAVKLYWRI